MPGEEPTAGCSTASYFGPPCTPVYLLSCVLSVAVNFGMRASFCIVFALIIHTKAPFAQFAGIGIDLQTATAFISILICSVLSKVGVSISGPDIIAAIVFSSMASIIGAENKSNPDAALATLLVAQLISTAVVGVAWLLLVRYRWTRILTYVPVSVIMGFLGCIGYKVVKESFKQATGDWWYYPETWEFWMLLLPTLAFGTSLFMLKKFHVFHPVVLLPFFLVVPVAMFYVVSRGALGYSMAELRDRGWFYPQLNYSTIFYTEYKVLRPGLVDGAALVKCLPEMLVLLLFATMECLIWLKTTGTELGLEIDMEYEVKLASAQTLLSLAVLGVPAYSQAKSNLLNYSIIGNTTERRVGIATALLCGMLWFADFPVVEVIPRFFLGGLLLYVAIPLLENNLLAAYFHLTKKEFVAVWIIFLTNAIAGQYSKHSLVFALLAGVAIAFVIFALQSGNINIIRAEMTGRDYQSMVLRSYDEMHLLDRIGHRFVIVELQHFIFFGSATQLLDLAKDVVRSQDPDNMANHIR